MRPRARAAALSSVADRKPRRVPADASRGNPAPRAAALACGDWFGRAAARLQSGRLLRRARYRTQRADLCARGVRQRNRSAENTRSRPAGILESTFDRGCLNSAHETSDVAAQIYRQSNTRTPEFRFQIAIGVSPQGNGALRHALRFLNSYVMERRPLCSKKY